jgi:APA family basic amino acid/polyamine antiporter
VSVLISGVAALLTSVCYGELAVEYPLSGAAFSYTMLTFGDFPAFICLASLLLEYAIGNAVVARGFSTYLARLLNLEPGYFRVGDKGPCGNAQGGKYDIMAAGVTLLVSVMLALGGRENAVLISGVTLLKLVLLVLIAIVGFTHANGAQMTPFTQPQFGFDGLWIGAALLFFIYTGFGALGAAAEEVTEVRHIPYALVGTSVIAGLVSGRSRQSMHIRLHEQRTLGTWAAAACPEAVPHAVSHLAKL